MSERRVKSEEWVGEGRGVLSMVTDQYHPEHHSSQHIHSFGIYI